MEFPRVAGEIGNARADHFEETTQAAIATTPWALGPRLAKMVKAKIKRIDGTELTDLDCLGENDRRLLLVSCKSLIYSAQYDAGDYKAVRNIKTLVVEAVKQWSDVAAYLKEHSKGPNYDFSEYVGIIPVVCTPHVAYVADAYALRFVEPGLYAACSLDELRTWLANSR